ncbi:MAG: HAMP domain-containing sensor histidine kinase [Nostocoides sp.]
MSPVTFVKPAAWTLRAKIVASVLVMFVFVMLATGLATVLFSRDYLLHQLDADVTNAAQRGIGTPSPTNGTRGSSQGDQGGRGGDGVLRVAIADGKVLYDRTGNPVNQVVNEHNQATTLTTAQIAILQKAQLGDRLRTVDLGGDVGTYRLVAVAVPTVEGTPATLIMGLPTVGVDNAARRMVWIVSGSTLIGLVLVGAGGTLLVRRNLEPLERVAATARRVSNLKLDTGDVALAERVAPRDTDPRTEVGQVGLAFNRMLDNVDGALHSRQESEMRVRQFVADASHELRTPLASIRGYAELSRREKDPVPPGVTHALSRVESEAQRMTSLVEDLLLLARLDEGRPLDREEVDLSMIAINAVSDAHAASPTHSWQLDLPDQPVTVTGDGARLYQVLTNLLANARTHTPSGTTVVTSVQPADGAVRISVTDNGPGIPEPLQSKVFERFTRGDDSRSRAAGSTGLGLSIVAAVGQAHGGTVDVESHPGRTSFSITLPRTPGESAA